MNKSTCRVCQLKPTIILHSLYVIEIHKWQKVPIRTHIVKRCVYINWIGVHWESVLLLMCWCCAAVICSQCTRHIQSPIFFSVKILLHNNNSLAIREKEEEKITLCITEDDETMDLHLKPIIVIVTTFIRVCWCYIEGGFKSNSKSNELW